MSDLEGTKRAFLVNLKPVKLGGIESAGMLLCGSKVEGEDKKVGLLSVPDNAQAGQKIVIEGFEKDVADDRLNPKKKIWETLAPEFKVDGEGNCVYKDSKIMLEGGDQLVSAMKNASIS